MKKLIDKSALVAEIERRNVICKKVALDLRTQENKDYYQGKAEAYKEALNFLNTLEVKDANEALRTEYEKGRADVIVEIEKCYEKAITAEAQTYLIKDLLDRLKTKK